MSPFTLERFFDPFDDGFDPFAGPTAMGNNQQMVQHQQGQLFRSPFDYFGNMFSSMSKMMADMEQMAGRFQNQDGSGVYQSQVMCMTQVMGEDGKVHVKKYAHSDIGDLSRKQREVKEAYTDSTTGTDKALHFRQLDNRAHRVYSQRNRGTGHVDTQDEVAGFERTHISQFEEDWRNAPALPRSMIMGSASPVAMLSDNRYQQQQQQRPALTNYYTPGAGGTNNNSLRGGSSNNNAYKAGTTTNNNTYYKSNSTTTPTSNNRYTVTPPSSLPSTNPSYSRSEVQSSPFTPGQRTPYIQACDSMVDSRRK